MYNFSSSLRPGTKGFTCGKWFIDYNFGIDDRAESKFGTHKEPTVLNILKYKYCVNKSRDMTRDYFAKTRKLLTNGRIARWRYLTRIYFVFALLFKFANSAEDKRTIALICRRKQQTQGFW